MRRCGLRAVVIATLVFSGCTTCTPRPWTEASVTDERADPTYRVGLGDSAALVAWIADDIASFQRVSAADQVCLGEVAVVDDIPGEWHATNAQGEPVVAVADGQYDWGSERVEFILNARFPENLDHELCHVLDRATGLSDANADWLTVEVLPDSIADDFTFRASSETEEVFAALCAAWPGSWFDRLLEDACGLDTVDDAVRRVDDLAFPGSIPTVLPPVNIAITPVALALPNETTTIRDVAAVAGVPVLYLRDSSTGVSSVATLAADGTVTIVASLPAEMWASQLFPSDGPIVLRGSRAAFALVDGGFVSHELPDVSWFDGFVDRGTLVVGGIDWDSHERPLVAVDLATGATRSLTPPEPGHLELGTRAGRGIAASQTAAWRFDHDAWTSIPQPRDRSGIRSRATLNDGGEIFDWFASGGHGGLGYRDPEGAMRLQGDPCESTDGFDGSLVTDGSQVWLHTPRTLAVVAVDRP